MLKYVLSAETKKNYAIYNGQAFAASIMRPLHQIYVYLPKMVPLKWGCMGCLVLGYLGR